MLTLQNAESVLQNYYGYPTFRSGQKQIVDSILSRNNTLGIMPTGGGKSICYQIPALMLPGITIVISPLISLMKDQVDGLNQVGIAATYISSFLSPQEIDQRVKDMKKGIYKLLYMAPERLESQQFRMLLNVLPIDLITIDEAHCISEWGHDFRPSYRAMAKMLQQLAKKPIIAALTATATEEVRKDIAELLSISAEHVYTTPLQRSNLSFSVRFEDDKRTFIRTYLEKHSQQTGIIYCATRKEVDGLHQYLTRLGFNTAPYHAGLPDEERDLAQEKFSYDQIQTIIATNAFGMGIDKSNVRFVLHYNLPKNLESYYQEAGRAGRDGDESECILLYSPQDVRIQKFLIENSELTMERRQHDLYKLQRIQDYCFTETCLQNRIVQYFGDPSTDPCQKCSCCRQLITDELVDITLEAQKIFSCIKRMQERYGLSTVAKVLKGSRNKKLLEWRLDRIPTYGIMRDRTEKEIYLLCQMLTAEGYLDIQLSNQSLPIAKLSPKAMTVLRGEQTVSQRRKASKDQPKQIIQTDSLFESLRILRKKLSEQERLPPYIIFPDSTLKEMCKHLPQTQSTMLSITGVGERKYQKYGPEFLAVIKDHIEKNNIEMALPQDEETPVKNDKTPSHLISYQLHQQGKTNDEIAQERSMNKATIEEHLLRCGLDELPLDWGMLIPASYEAIILKKIEELGTQKLRPLKESLPEAVDYIAIKATIVKHKLLTNTPSSQPDEKKE